MLLILENREVEVEVEVEFEFSFFLFFSRGSVVNEQVLTDSLNGAPYSIDPLRDAMRCVLSSWNGQCTTIHHMPLMQFALLPTSKAQKKNIQQTR